MRKQQRHALVLEVLERDGDDRVVNTRELAERLDVSEMTIRRDLRELAQKGLIQRVHGGATLPRHSAPSRMRRGHIGILRTSGKDKYIDPFFSQVLEGADRKLQESGYRTAFIFSYADVHTEEQARDLLQNYSADGILLIGAHASDGIEYLRKNTKVLVATAGTLGPHHDAILIDWRTGIREMVDHLARLGRRRLAFLAGYFDEREQGFLDGIAAHHLPDEPELRVAMAKDFEDWSPELGRRGAARLMQMSNPPDAIVCASDRLAIGAMQWLHQNSYRVPEDVAVTGFDNIPDSEFTIPPLTTIHVHKEWIGILAAERAIRRIENPDEIPLQIVTPTAMIIRQSCGVAM